MFILLMQFLWRYIDDLVGKGLGAAVISELLMYASVSLVPMALPLAILLSSIMTFGDLAEHYELMAIKSAGVSLMKIMKPLIILVLFLSAGAFLFSNNVMPYANLKMQSLLWDVKHQRPEVSISEGIFSDALEGYTIKVGHKSRKTPMLYDIMIYNHTADNGNRDVTLADSGTMIMTADKHFMVLTLYNGVNYVEEYEKRVRWTQREFPQRTTRFRVQQFSIDMSGLGFERSDEALFKNGYAMLNLSQLQYTTDSLNKRYDERTDKYVDKLTTTNYFQKLNLKREDSLWLSQTAIPVTTNLDMDSAFSTMSKMDRHNVLYRALESARSTKTYISQSVGDFERDKKIIKRHEIEWHRKFTLSIACLLLFFIGAPLGAIIRKGGLGTPIVVSVICFVLYYVVNISGEKAAKMGSWPTWLGMWISSMVFAPIGAFLTYKAVKDATLLELSTYTDFFRKVFDKMMTNRTFAAIVNHFVSEEKKAKAKLAAELERKKQALFNSFNQNGKDANA